MTRVTIGVPVFDGSDTLPATIECILQQQHRDIEVLVSIDGGDVESASAIGRYLTDNRVRVVQQADRLGWADNLSWLMRQCRTTLFCYWQQDDLASSDYLTELVRIHQQCRDTSVAYTDVQWFGEATAREHLPSIDSPVDRDRVIQYMDEQHWIPLRGVIRADLLRVMPPSAQLRSDSPFENGFLAYLAGCAPMRRCETALYFKRSHPKQWGRSFELRPPDRRRIDWIVRAGAMFDIIEEFSTDDDMAATMEAVVERFARPPSGRFADHHYHERPVQGFLRDVIAVDGNRWEDRVSACAATGRLSPSASIEMNAQHTRREVVDDARLWSLAEGADRSGESFLGFGWSHREHWGVWSDALRPTIFIPRVNAPGLLRLHGTHHGTHGALARVQWAVDDHVSGSQNVVCELEASVDIPVEPGQATIQLHLPDAVSPLTLGASTDRRLLGFGLHRLEFCTGM